MDGAVSLGTSTIQTFILFPIPVKTFILISELSLKIQSLISLKLERKSIILLFLTLSFSKITLKRLRKLLKSLSLLLLFFILFLTLTKILL